MVLQTEFQVHPPVISRVAVPFQIIDDGIPEDTETFMVLLESGEYSVDTTADRAQFSITDDDCKLCRNATIIQIAIEYSS